MTDRPLPGLEPHQGPLDARHAHWLTACKVCRRPVLRAVDPRGRSVSVDANSDSYGSLTLTIRRPVGCVGAGALHAGPVDKDTADTARYMPHSCPTARRRNRKASP